MRRYRKKRGWYREKGIVLGFSDDPGCDAPGRLSSCSSKGKS